MRVLSGHPDYRIELELSKFGNVVRRSLGHVHIDKHLPVAYQTNSRHLRAIPWPSGRWRARRRIDTGKPAGSMPASTHGGTCSHVAVAGGVWGGERGAAAAAVARRRAATPTGGAVIPPRSAPARGRDGARAGGWDRPPRDGPPLTVPRDGVRNRRLAAATAAGAQARSPAGHRGLVEPRKSLHVVAARNSGRWGGGRGAGAVWAL